MKTNPEALLIGLCLAVCWALLTIARGLLVPLLALLLTLAGWRSRPALVMVPEALVGPPAVPPALSLHSLKVSELRQLARQAGFNALARNGRKADLLMALTA